MIHIAPNNEPLLELMIRLAGMFSGIFIVSHGIHAGIMKVWLKSSLDVQAEQVVPLLALGK